MGKKSGSQARKAHNSTLTKQKSRQANNAAQQNDFADRVIEVNKKDVAEQFMKQKALLEAQRNFAQMRDQLLEIEAGLTTELNKTQAGNAALENQVQGQLRQLQSLQGELNYWRRVNQ